MRILAAYLIGVLLSSTKTLVALGLCQELDVGTTTFKTFLKFDLVLDDQRLALGVDRLREQRRDGVMCGL